MKLDNYQEKFERLIELEQEEEMKRHEREMKRLSALEREEKGRCLVNMSIGEQREGMGDEILVTYEKEDSKDLPDHEIQVGDLVQTSKKYPLDEDNPTGTVWSRSRDSITVSMTGEPPKWAQAHVRIDLYVDNITSQRMKDALFLLSGLSREQDSLKQVLLGEKTPYFEDLERDPEFKRTELNESQERAVRRAMEAREVALVHGPPGTGKTVTLSEVIYQAVQRGNEVLATTASNIAVDHLLIQLIDLGLDVVRIGHPARTLPSLRNHSLDVLVEETEAYRKSQGYREEAMDLVEERREYTAPRGKYRRGMSNDQIHSLAEQNRGNRGLPPETIQEMSSYLELSEEIDELFDRCDQLEEEATDEVIENADVVCTTNSTAGSDILSGYRFDWLCIDEATQATEPSCLIPITKAKKLVMAGDHRQLPPTVLNTDAREGGLQETMFERLMYRWNESISRRLNVQYRMHEDIMDFSSEQFYDGELDADESVCTHTLENLPEYEHSGIQGEYREVVRPRPVVQWLDTSSHRGSERQREGSTSWCNPVQAELTEEIARSFLEAGVKPKDLAIITPYSDQQDLLTDRLTVEELEIDTVDGFQGREKELVVIDFVRSNHEGEVGFLYDARRLNVSLTRARRKLVLVGDFATLQSQQLYRNLYDYVRNRGEIISD
ncbi:MAG: IGHMBP2 family helicase [bacterium]